METNEFKELSFNDFSIKEKFPILKKGKKSKSNKKNNKISEEELNKKQSLIFKILKYQDNKRFGHILKKLNIKYTYQQLNKLTLDVLNEVIQRIYVNLNNDGIDKMYDMLVHQTSHTFEKTVSPFYDINGFSNSLLCDDTFLNLLERYKIEHSLPNIPIGVQLSLVITKHMLLVNTKNKLNKNNKTPSKIKINKNYKIKKPSIDPSILK